MNKKVTETEVKLFSKYEDALADVNFSMEMIEYEGHTEPPYMTIKNKYCMLIPLKRKTNGDSVIEKCYIVMQ